MIVLYDSTQSEPVMHLKHTTLLFCHAEHRPITSFHPHGFPTSEHGPAMSDTWLERRTSQLLRYQHLIGCTLNICPMKVLKKVSYFPWFFQIVVIEGYPNSNNHNSITTLDISMYLGPLEKAHYVLPFYLYFFYSYIVQMQILPWEIRAFFPRKSQLRQSRATQPTVHSGCFSVSITHRTLTWTIWSSTCAQMLMHAIAHGGVRTP